MGGWGGGVSKGPCLEPKMWGGYVGLSYLRRSCLIVLLSIPCYQIITGLSNEEVEPVTNYRRSMNKSRHALICRISE